MWISIEIIPQSEEVIYLPKQLAGKLKEKINVSFGQRSADARVESSKDNHLSTGKALDNPLKIRFSSKLAFRLQIPATLSYKMKFNSEYVVIGPVIGMLLGNYDYLYSPCHMEKYSDRLGIYNQVGGLIYAFSPNDIDWQNHLVYGLYYNDKKSAWQFGRFPLPSAIYRRDFHSSPEGVEKLIEVTQGRMFNSWRFTKYYLYEYMKQDYELSQYLPDSELSSNFEQVRSFMESHNSIILKPIHLSRGRGICIIKKDGSSYRVFDYRSSVPAEYELTDDKAFEEFFSKNEGFFDRYIVQKHLELADIEGSRFDIRVVMQKVKPSEWECTGIECRVAAKERLVTNISRGGYALTIDDALRQAFPSYTEENENVKKELDNLCHKICESLDKTGHHFAEFGMDIAVDKDRNLWIIEVNVFPSFKGFKTLDYKTYLKIRYTPFLYAAYLAGFNPNVILRGE